MMKLEVGDDPRNVLRHFKIDGSGCDPQPQNLPTMSYMYT